MCFRKETDMNKEEAIKKLELIQWTLRHNIPTGIAKLDDGLADDDRDYEEYLLNLLEDKLYYLTYTHHSVGDVLNEDEIELFEL